MGVAADVEGSWRVLEWREATPHILAQACAAIGAVAVVVVDAGTAVVVAEAVVAEAVVAASAAAGIAAAVAS